MMHSLNKTIHLLDKKCTNVHLFNDQMVRRTRESRELLQW